MEDNASTPEANHPLNEHDHAVASDDVKAEALSVDSVCHQLRMEFENMRKALTCSICMSTFREACIITNCVHAYCSECIRNSLSKQKTHLQCCPLCQVPCNRRNLRMAPDLDRYVVSYKRAVRHFGLAPVVYTPQLQMTQVENDGIEGQPENLDATELLDEWQTSRTFARVFRNEKEHPVASVLLEEQEQIVAVNQQVYNDNRIVPTYSQIAGAALSQQQADQSLLEEEEDFYSACDQPPTQLMESSQEVIMKAEEEEKASRTNDQDTTVYANEGQKFTSKEASSDGPHDATLSSTVPSLTMADQPQDSLSSTTVATGTVDHTMRQKFCNKRTPSNQELSQKNGTEKSAVIQNRVRSMVAAMEVQSGTKIVSTTSWVTSPQECSTHPLSTIANSVPQTRDEITTIPTMAPDRSNDFTEEEKDAESSETNLIGESDKMEEQEDRKPAAIDWSNDESTTETKKDYPNQFSNEEKGVMEGITHNPNLCVETEFTNDCDFSESEGNEDAVSTPESTALRIGNVVDVQPRTWPGVK